MKLALVVFLVLALVVTIGVAVARPPEAAGDEVEWVSLIQLIANPREFDGKAVRIIGYARIEFEGTAIYMHEADSKYAISKNAVWLDTLSADDGTESFRSLDRQYALVEGTFSAQDNGHGGAFSGAITHVTRHIAWSTMDGREASHAGSTGK